MSNLSWERGSNKIIWNGTEIIAPASVLWAVELTSQEKLIVVTIFDENTPVTISNGFVYTSNTSFIPINIYENNRNVRFLGCYLENNKVIINATNNTEYVVDPVTIEINSTRYYR